MSQWRESVVNSAAHSICGEEARPITKNRQFPHYKEKIIATRKHYRLLLPIEVIVVIPVVFSNGVSPSVGGASGVCEKIGVGIGGEILRPRWSSAKRNADPQEKRKCILGKIPIILSIVGKR